MAGVLAFWFAALVIAAAALPIAFILLRRLPDAGAGLAPVLGLVLTAWAYFILRTLDILGPGRGGFLLAVALLAVTGIGVARLDLHFSSTLRRIGPQAFLYAGIFTVAFFAYAAFRSYQSSIGGTEQPMDLMYLNAMLTSPDYPPHDPWLAGEPAAYYYFGYLQAAVLTSLSGVTASVGYNLALAGVFASSATAVASLGAAVARWLLGRRRRLVPVAAATSVGLLLFASSLIGAFELAAAHGHGSRPVYEAFGVDNILPCPADAEPGADCYRSAAVNRTTSWYPTEFWFWWRGSRVIEGTITEFPFFSFLLGDLHPHVMSIPLVLLAMGLALAAARGRSRFSFATIRADPFPAAVVAIVLGALAFQNAWDVVTFSALFALAVAYRNLRSGFSLAALRGAAAYLGTLALAAAIAYLPWLLVFDSQARGIRPYVGAGTPPLEGLLQFGAPVLASVCLLAWAAMRLTRRECLAVAPLALWVPVLPLLVWAPLAAAHGELGEGIAARAGGGWITLAVLGLLTWANVCAFLAFAARRHASAVAFALAAFASTLLLGAELFLVRDVFFGSVPRLNTVFKLGYQAWILLSVAGGAGVALVLARSLDSRRATALAMSPFALVAILALVYPVLAVPNRAGGFSGESSTDGFATLARNNPAEYSLARWVEDNVPPSATIIEAPSDSYSGTGARVASRTGRAIPIGWYFHETQWRGDTEANHARFRAIQDTVDRVYTAESAEDLLQAMEELDARYVVVGSHERSRYASSTMTEFEPVLDLVFESGDVRVYALPVQAVLSTS